jgi:hypothetical protein
MEFFRLFLLAQDGLDQGAAHGDGLEIDMPFTLGVVWALLCTDVLQDLEYQIRPYEVIPGSTDQVVKESVEYLCDVFQKRPYRGKKWGSLLWHLTTDYFVKALREVYRKFERIELDRLRVKPIVKITGEFYLQTVEGAPNYHMHRWLESEGAEVYPAATAIWLDYWMTLKAALYPTESVLHIVGFIGPVEAYFPASEIVEIRLSLRGFERLCAFIQEEYARDASGGVTELGPGLYGNSRFYLGRKKFHLLRTCNVWTARAIRSTGFPITPFYAITASNVIHQASKYGRMIRSE